MRTKRKTGLKRKKNSIPTTRRQVSPDSNLFILDRLSWRKSNRRIRLRKKLRFMRQRK